MATTKLKTQLERLYRTYDIAFLSSDPLEFVHRYKDARDREIAGLIASSLAYGKVTSIKKSVETVLALMDNKPYGFVSHFKPEKHEKAFSGFTHRFNNGDDIRCLLYFMKQMFEASGSIGGFFTEAYEPDEKNIKSGLISFCERTLSLDSMPIYKTKKLPEKAGVRFFFPSPLDGSPCKRLCLYLRWMVRRGDALDFGIWKDISPSKLVMPLDTHVARISRYIGLTKRESASWLMAEEVTENLKKLDPKDPVKYDFAIARLGILEECKGRKKPEKCKGCLIRELCVVR